MLKWAEGTAIKVAYRYLYVNPDLRSVERAPTGARVEALVGRLRAATGLALELVGKWPLTRDHSIDVVVVDGNIPDLTDTSDGIAISRKRKHQKMHPLTRIGKAYCAARVYHDEAHRLKIASLFLGFHGYAEADVSRCLAEAFAWMLGVPLWAPEDDKSEALGPFALIRALYDPRIEPGMTEAEVYPIIRDRLCGQR